MKKKGFRGYFIINCKDILEIKLPLFESGTIDFPIQEKHWVSSLAVVQTETFLKVASAQQTYCSAFQLQCLLQINKNKDAFICVLHKIKKENINFPC